MTTEDKEKVLVVNGCAMMIGEALVCVAIGSYYQAWEAGVALFGTALIIHCIWVKWKLRKTP